jgi:hypothetical protein
LPGADEDGEQQQRDQRGAQVEAHALHVTPPC